MRILITTGIYPPDIGGVATFASSLEKAIQKEGHRVRVLHYGLEKSLPIGIRHFWFFLRTCAALTTADALIALDTISTGFPAGVAGRLFGVPRVIRVSGDFLWESFVERTKEKVSLPGFYEKSHLLTRKEIWIKKILRFTLNQFSQVVFNTDWQKQIWTRAYRIPSSGSRVIENVYGIDTHLNPIPAERCFLWAGRPITLKNIDVLKEVFQEEKIAEAATLECLTNASHAEVLQKIKESYAIILPSYSDVSPNIILEGIRVGKPFVITKHTGISEGILKAGIQIDPFDKTSIREGILKLCEGETYDGYRKILEGIHLSHSPENVAQEFLNLMIPNK